MSKFFMYGTDLHELEQLMMLVPNFTPRRSGVIVMKERIKRMKKLIVKHVIFRFMMVTMELLVYVIQMTR